MAKQQDPADDELDRLTAPQSQLVRGTVARGRSILGPDPGKTQKRIVGMHPDTGKPLTMSQTREFLPGETFETTPEEMAWLRELGTVIDPNRLASDKEAERVQPLDTGKGGGVGFVSSQTR